MAFDDAGKASGVYLYKVAPRSWNQINFLDRLRSLLGCDSRRGTSRASDEVPMDKQPDDEDRPWEQPGPCAGIASLIARSTFVHLASFPISLAFSPFVSDCAAVSPYQRSSPNAMSALLTVSRVSLGGSVRRSMVTDARSAPLRTSMLPMSFSTPFRPEPAMRLRLGLQRIRLPVYNKHDFARAVFIGGMWSVALCRPQTPRPR